MSIELHVVFSEKYLKNLSHQKVLTDVQIASDNQLLRLTRFYESSEVNLVKTAEAFIGYPESINEIFTNYFGVIDSYLASIEEIVEREELSAKAPIVIHLYGGYDQYNFSMINGIGEEKAFFLRKEDIYNKYIFDRFSGRYAIKWHRKRTKITSYLYSLRGFLLFSSMSFFQAFKVFKKNDSVNVINKEIDLENSQPQKLFFASLSNKAIFNVNDFSLNSLFTLFKCMRDGFNATKHYFPSYFTYGSAINSNMTLFFSLLHMQTKAKILSAQLKPLEKVKKIRTAMTYGNDISTIHQFCTANNISHVNFQAVTLRKMYLPNHHIADKYFILDETVRNFYCDRFEKFRFLKLVRILHQQAVKKEEKRNQFVITFFSQPEEYSRYIKTFIEEFLQNVAADIVVNIKPHYREDEADYLFLQERSSQVHVIPPSRSSCEVIMQSDLVLSISSTVLKEASYIRNNAVRLDILGSNNDSYLFNNIPTVNATESLRSLIQSMSSL